MTSTAFIADRVAVLEETEAIERDLLELEQRGAVDGDIRVRLHRVRITVLEQLHALLDAPPATIH